MKNQLDIPVAFTYGNHDTEPDTILLKIQGIGLDLENKEHRTMVESILPIIAGQLYKMVNKLEHEIIVEEDTAIHLVPKTDS